MKFVLFVEGFVEDKALPQFFGGWLNDQLNESIRIEPVNLQGSGNLWKEIDGRAKKYLQSPRSDQIIGVVSLLDLYGLDVFPAKVKSVEERYRWAKSDVEKRVGHPNFRQHFAVHETEAWLLSDPRNPGFSNDVRRILGAESWKERLRFPERINFDKPPAVRLNDVFKQAHNGRGYQKTVDGPKLFRGLDPVIARDRCPYLKLMLDEMLDLARTAGL